MEPQSHFVRHLIGKHGKEDKVLAALQLPPGKGRTAAFNNVKKEGILAHNQEVLSKGDDTRLQREYSTSKSSQNPEDMRMCGNCQGFYAAKHLYKHKQDCARISSRPYAKIQTVPISFLNCNSTSTSNPDFDKKVMPSFRDNAIGNMCREDETLRIIGLHQWEKSAKKDNAAKKSVTADMRHLAKLVLTIRSESRPTFTCIELFDKTNFKILEKAMKSMTELDDKGENLTKEKNNLKVTLWYLLKTSAMIMVPTYLIADQKEEAEEVETFIKILEHKRSPIINPAVYEIQIENQERLRQPKRLPLEADIKKIFSYIETEMKQLDVDGIVWDEPKFNHLRGLLIARLTMYNGRRGGEVAKMTLDHWKKAKCETWINQQKKPQLDILDQLLIDRTKLAYIKGKGKSLVSILIPHDCISATDRLVSVRMEVGINQENKFLFAAGRGSTEAPQGSQVMTKMCNASGVDLYITATDMRHRASEEYSLLDCTEAEKKTWYDHMGHSAQVSTMVYACPAGIREVVQVGAFLNKLDQTTKDHGKKRLNFNRWHIPY
jgi:integrase